MTRVNRNHFKGNLQSIYQPHSFPPPQRVWTDKEMNRLRLGVIPSDKNHKWFAFMEGNTLFIHLSWSGHAVYRLEFAEDDDKRNQFRIISALVTDHIHVIYARLDDSEEQGAVEEIILNPFDL